MAVFTKIGLDEINLIEKNFSIGKILNYSGIKKGIENTNYLIKSKKRNIVAAVTHVLPTGGNFQICQGRMRLSGLSDPSNPS